MKLLLIFYAALLFQTPFVFLKSIPTDAADFMIDELGNIYLIHNTFIERINAVGGNTFRTSELNFGNIEYFDVTNPLKPFIHYRSQGKIIVFDNTLSEQGSVDLFSRGYEQIELVGGSRGDAYWLWDSRNSEMIRVDQNFSRIASTGNLSILTGKQILPEQILERGTNVYLRDSNTGILIFDMYGSYKTTLNVKTSADIQVVNDEIIFEHDGHIHVIGRDLISESVYELPGSTALRVHFFNQTLYDLEPGALNIWGLKENTRN